MSHSFMKSTTAIQNLLFGLPPLDHGSYYRTYLCELQQGMPKIPWRLWWIARMIFKKHVTLRRSPNATRGKGYAYMLYQNIKLCFMIAMSN
jgi:hypothetical protein